jgi:hypothetical protein
MASWLVGPVYRDIERHFPGNYSLILVFDLALLTGRSAAARSVFLAKARECGRRFEAGYFTQPLAASAAYRQATRASLELVRALGVKVELVSSAAEAVRILRLRALSLGVESEAPATDAH